MGYRKLGKKLGEVIKKVWQGMEYPEEWKEGIIVLIKKKETVK